MVILWKLRGKIKILKLQRWEGTNEREVREEKSHDQKKDKMGQLLRLGREQKNKLERRLHILANVSIT